MRIQKALEDMNIKLGNVVSDAWVRRAVLGKITEGETNPETLADEARGSLKSKRPQLVEALRGRATDHHRFLLKLHLDMIDLLQGQVDQIDERLGVRSLPFDARSSDLLLLGRRPGDTDAS